MKLEAYTKEFGTNVTLAIPVVVGMIGHTMVGFIDNIMVGKLGSAALAAVSLGNSFIFIAISLGIGFSTAITPLVAASDAANDPKGVKAAFKHGLVLCTTLGLLLFFGIYFSGPLLALMDQPDEVVQMAKPYLYIVGFSLIPMIIFQGFKQFSDGMSLTKFPMYATLLANVVNVVLNYLLIFGKFGFPELGIVGAAYGTLVSRFIMVFVLWWMLKGSRKTKQFLQNIKFLQLDFTTIKKIMSLGFPSALQMLFEVGIFTSAIWLSGWIGTNAQAANQIALNLASMTFMVAMGLNVTAMIRVGNQKGLKRYSELRRIAFSIFFMSILIEIVFALFFFLLHEHLPLLYLDFDSLTNRQDSLEVLHLASNLLLAAAIFQISDGIQVVVLGALRGLQDVKIPTWITFFSYWIIGFPVSYYLGKPENYGTFGIWLGLLAGLTSAAILLFLRFNYLSKQYIFKNSN